MPPPGRWVRRVVWAAIALGIAWDVSRPPARQWSAALAIGGIHLYQNHLSGLAGQAGVSCRFTPSCSRYAEALIRRDGIVAGSWKAVRRIARCGPWTPPGTIDEPS